MFHTFFVYCRRAHFIISSLDVQFISLEKLTKYTYIPTRVFKKGRQYEYI